MLLKEYACIFFSQTKSKIPGNLERVVNWSFEPELMSTECPEGVRRFQTVNKTVLRTQKKVPHMPAVLFIFFSSLGFLLSFMNHACRVTSVCMSQWSVSLAYKTFFFM